MGMGMGMLTDKIHMPGDMEQTPEDIMSSSLGVIFPDDIAVHHGDSTTTPIYLSPLYGPLTLTLVDPVTETSHTLFSHFLWNASVLLAEYLEEGPFPLWDVRGETVLELGAGSGLASLISALRGAKETVVSDYPAEEVLANLRGNVEGNVRQRRALKEGEKGFIEGIGDIRVQGHEWGILDVSPHAKDSGFARDNKGAFSRLLVADCVWMPWQHSNLRKSIAWFLTPPASSTSTSHQPPSEDWTPQEGGKAYVIGGFHTGRAKMKGFFEEEGMREDGLFVERIWERNAEGVEREWAVDRGEEDKDISRRKRWLAVAIVRRLTFEEEASKQREKK